MAHIRKTIRENVKTAITGLSTTGTSVYETRYFPLQTGNLPALIVYTLDETIEDYTLGKNTRTQQRALNLIIEAHCRGTANIDDTLDTIAEEVEEAMRNPNSSNYEKYIKIRKLNLHKMEPIPVCKIPK